MFASPWIAGLVALFVWWFSTGVILVLVRRADRIGGHAHRRTTLAALPLFALGWLGLWWSTGTVTALGAYAGFFSAILIWGWVELAFLTGVITGPNMKPCPEDVQPWERFVRAWGTIAHSELVLIASVIVIIAISSDAVNSFGFWTFAVLFFARISAKLNIYLGVPNINIEFLPLPMRHLASHFRIAPMNGFFPVAVSALTFATACWLERGWVAGTEMEMVGFALLAALTSLALLEHWVMVLPIPDAKLWRWMMPELRDTHSNTAIRHEDAHGL